MSATRGQDLHQAHSRIVTLVIRHQPLAGQQDAYQRWLQRAVTAAREACGHLGVDVIPPAEAGTAFTTLVRFADVDQLQAWLASPERQALIAEVAPLLREARTRKTKRRSGTCTCGAARPAPGASSIVSNMSRTKRRISGAPGSGTGSQRSSSTGWPMRAIFRMAMAGLPSGGWGRRAPPPAGTWP